MRIRELPIEIQQRVEVYRPGIDPETSLVDAFGWAGRAEPQEVWRAAHAGDYEPFFKIYPKEEQDNTTCNVTIYKDSFILNSFISPSTSKMVINKEQAKLLIEKLNEFIK